MMSQDLINLTFSVAGAVVGWVLKVIWEAIKELQHDMREIENELHTEYVNKDDYRQDIIEIKTILREIFDDLKRKADR